MENSNGLPEKNLKLDKTELLRAQQEQDSAAALYKAAYDHPVAFGIGAAAAVGAAVCAARTGAVKRLLAGKPDVLLIEDTRAMGAVLRDALSENGHKVTWVTGIKSLNPLTGIKAEGGELVLNKGFKVALVDGDLGKASLSGPEIVGTLRDRRIMSIGTSSVESFNTAMKSNGAAIVGNKATIYTSILGGKLDLQKALKAPARTQEELSIFAGSLMKPENDALRRAADSKLMRYFSEEAATPLSPTH